MNGWDYRIILSGEKGRSVDLMFDGVGRYFTSNGSDYIADETTPLVELEKAVDAVFDNVFNLSEKDVKTVGFEESGLESAIVISEEKTVAQLIRMLNAAQIVAEESVSDVPDGARLSVELYDGEPIVLFFHDARTVISEGSVYRCENEQFLPVFEIKD